MRRYEGRSAYGILVPGEWPSDAGFCNVGPGIAVNLLTCLLRTEKLIR